MYRFILIVVDLVSQPGFDGGYIRRVLIAYQYHQFIWMKSQTVWISDLYNRLNVARIAIVSDRVALLTLTSDSSAWTHATTQLNMLSYFSDDSSISYQNVISGVTVWPKLPLRTIFKYLITERTRRGKKPQQVIRANIAGLCIEWNKWEAIPYFWSYFLITLQRTDFVVVSPMDLLHLFHWPRLLQLNVHQFVRISWLSFLLFPIIRALFFFRLPPLLSSARLNRCATMRLQFFRGS